MKLSSVFKSFSYNSDYKKEFNERKQDLEGVINFTNESTNKELKKIFYKCIVKEITTIARYHKDFQRAHRLTTLISNDKYQDEACYEIALGIFYSENFNSTAFFQQNPDEIKLKIQEKFRNFQATWNGIF